MDSLSLLLKKYRTPLLVIVGVALLAYFVVRGWGDALGMDPEFRDEFIAAAHAVWMAAISAFGASFKEAIVKDEDENGIADILE